MPAPRRSARLAPVLAALLLAAGCGTTEPKPLEPIATDVPADLCALLPAAARAGLIANANTDDSGNPTAACSLRSPEADKPTVQALVTWLQAGDETSSADIWSSQCRAIDRRAFREQSGFRVKGADQACSGAGTVDGTDSATLAAVSGHEVVTVRFTSLPAGGVAALTRARELAESVLGSLADGS